MGQLEIAAELLLLVFDDLVEALAALPEHLSRIVDNAFQIHHALTAVHLD